MAAKVTMTDQQLCPIAFPQTDPVEDVLHGIRIADPYRVLEDRDSEATRNWIERQQMLHAAYFSEIAGLGELRTRISEALTTETIDEPAEIGTKRFFRRRAGDVEQPSIYVSDLSGAHEFLLVDPSAHGRFVSVAIHCISDDGSLLAYELKRGGTDTEEIRFLKVGSGGLFPDAIPNGHARGLAFISDNTGYYYCHDLPNVTNNVPHEVRCHKFGTHADHDRVLFRAPRTARSRLVLIHDGHNLGAVWVHEQGSGMAIDLYLASRAADERWQAVFTNRTTPYGPFLEAGHIFVQSHKDAPNGKIMELDRMGAELRVIVPECGAQIQGLAIAGQRIYVHYLINLDTIVRCWTLSGEAVGPLRVPENGSLTFLPSYSNRKETLFYSHESFTDPPRIIQYRPESQEHLVWASLPAWPTHSKCTVQRLSYPSRDGTTIPISLLLRTDSDWKGERPAVLTAYGGFGVCMTPRFSVLVRTLVDLGAIFALPNIRGGCEFGSAWRDAARRQNRQLAYDDFIAAAEWLCRQRLTNAQKLGIFGGSNSGLLVGVAMTQRPDLFRAVLCIAPILDMLRYEILGHGQKWKEEYGTVEDATDFAALHAYSPYHRVREDVNYPAMLFVCGGKDDRCSPAHVWKMSARLQLRKTQTNPIVVDYDPERGHCPVSPLSIRIDALTRRVAFFCKELGIPVRRGAVA
jgi:prolyl oligopeptidase